VSLVSLDIFSAVAGVGAAIAISYAGLPSFRYKERVVNFVRSLVSPALINSLIEDYNSGGAICATGAWSTTYKLGDLGNWKCPLDWNIDSIPEPGIKRADAEKNRAIGDAGFHNDGLLGHIKYHLYNAFFANNLDKNIAITLGALCISVIWFGALDKWHFGLEPWDAYQHTKYLWGIIYWYGFLFILPLLSFLYYSFSIFSYKMWRLIKIGYSIFLFAAFITASLNHALWVKKFGIYAESTALLIIVSLLLISIVAPVLLLLFGGRLNVIVNSKGKACVDVIALLISEKTSQARLPVTPTIPAGVATTH
jgi:hypothetical protein